MQGVEVILSASDIFYLIPPGKTAEWKRQRACKQEVNAQGKS
jgi:hypothetical protein